MTSQLVTDRLARTVRSWDFPRHERPGTYPQFAPRGPVVLVTNQEAGSDGDIVGAGTTMRMEIVDHALLVRVPPGRPIDQTDSR